MFLVGGNQRVHPQRMMRLVRLAILLLVERAYALGRIVPSYSGHCADSVLTDHLVRRFSDASWLSLPPRQSLVLLLRDKPVVLVPATFEQDRVILHDIFAAEQSLFQGSILKPYLELYAKKGNLTVVSHLPFHHAIRFGFE